MIRLIDSLISGFLGKTFTCSYWLRDDAIILFRLPICSPNVREYFTSFLLVPYKFSHDFTILLALTHLKDYNSHTLQEGKVTCYSSLLNKVHLSIYFNLWTHA